MSDRQIVTSPASSLRLTGVAIAGVACFAISACSTLHRATGSVAQLVTPHKIEVVQGNFVSKEQKEALQTGMPRAQVRDILGSPMVTSAFHEDRWDYVFSLRRQGQEAQQRKLSVFFKGDELAKVESDELPSEQDFVSSLSQGRSLGKPALLEVPESVLVEFGLKNAAPAAGVVALNAASRPATNYPPLEAPGARASVWDASTLLASSNVPVGTAAAGANANAVGSLSAAVAQAPVLAPRSAAPAAQASATSSAPAPAPAPAAPAPIAPAPTAAPSVAPAITAAVTAAVTAPVAPRAPAASPSSAPVSAPASAPVAAPAAPVVVQATAPAARPATAVAATTITPPAPQLTPPPAPPPSPPSNLLASADPGITELLNRWSSDWQSRNVSAYFSHYVADFKGTLNTRADWEAQRRTRIEGRARISLAVQDIRVRMVSPTEARLVFRQDYESDAFRELGTKAMFLIKRDGRWLIEREFFTPLAQ
jgi:outer membrane protein assembly factor BamE